MRAWCGSGPRLLRVVERLNKERALRALLALRLPFTSGEAARTGARVEVLVADAAQDPVDQSPGVAGWMEIQSLVRLMQPVRVASRCWIL